MPNFVCQSLTNPNRNGIQRCVEWVEYQPESFGLASLAITKAQMVEIGGSILGIYALFIAYVVIAKAVNIL